MTEAKTINLEYWTAMRDYFEAKGTKINSQKPLPQHWTNFAIGRSNFHMAAVHSVRDKFIRVEFLINGNDSKEKFDVLKEKYETDSYSNIDPNLIWDKLEERKVSWVYLQKNVEVNNKPDWHNQFQWIMENLEKMDNFFRPKVKAL